MFKLLQALVAVALVACGSTKQPPPGDQPDAPPAGDCADGDACLVDGEPGLCLSGACGGCVDRLEDDTCAAAYGAGTLCAGGACITGTCHDASDCNGKPCVNNQCAGCAIDNDCNSGEICSSGACVPAGGACAGKAVGDSCGGGDLCCTRQGSLSCVEVECCGSGPDPSCAANEVCQGGSCVAAASGCTAPATATYFVDPAYTGPSTGTTTCPFKTLHGAFARIRNDDFTGDSDVIVKGGTIDATSEGGAASFPLTVPSSVFVRTATGVPDAKIVAPANTTAFQAPFVAQADATDPWAARLSHLDISQATAGTAGAGVLVTGGTVAKPVHLDHLTVHDFGSGIDVAGGKALLAFGVDAHHNTDNGLRIAAGRADIVVGQMADARTLFHDNKVGILVTGDPASQIVATGSEDANGLEQVAANSNLEAGIRVFSPNAGNLLSHVGANQNANTGLSVLAGAKLQVRNGRFKQNLQAGVRVSPNGTNQDASGLDLGTTASPGLNEFGGNNDGDLCVATTGPELVGAVGNIFGAVDCSKPAGGTVPLHRNGCAGAGAGVAFTASQTFPLPAVVSSCTFP